MNAIAKQNLNRLINHNVLLVAMVIISCLQVYNYIRLNKVSCIFIFLVTFILSYQAVSKNITISLFLAIFVANFLLGCASFIEGHTVMVHTPFPHDHKDPIDTKMIPGFDKGTSSSGGWSGGAAGGAATGDTPGPPPGATGDTPGPPPGAASAGASIGTVFSKHIIDPSFNQSTEGKCMAATKCTNSSYDCDWCVAGCCDCACVKQKKENVSHEVHKKEYGDHYKTTNDEGGDNFDLDGYLGNIFSDVDDTQRPTKGYGDVHKNTSTTCLAATQCKNYKYDCGWCQAGCCDCSCVTPPQ